MNGRLKGLILSNFLYLILFYIAYFFLVPMAGYMKDTMCNLDLFTTYCSAIPSSTVGAMNFLLYAVVPIAALIWTIISSREPQYTYSPQ